jgi:hypothetical protein
MFLNLTFLGMSPFTSYTPTIVPTTSYNKITIYGNYIVNQIWGRNELIDSAIIQAYTPTTYAPTWTQSTFILANLNDTLDGGNAGGLTNPITHWDIYRLKIGDTQSTYLTTVPVATTLYEDFKAILNEQYTYLLYGKNATEVGDPIQSFGIEPDYYGWFLIDEDNGIAYKFDTNVVSGSLNSEEDITEYAGNLEHSVFHRGKRKSIAGQIQAIIWDSNSSITYTQGNEILQQLKNFIFSDRNKLLKDRRGRIFRVETFGYSENQLDDRIPQQIIQCSFNFKEIGNVFN